MFPIRFCKGKAVLTSSQNCPCFLEFLPYIAVLWVLLHQFGLPGAALAWSARVIVNFVFLFKFSRFPAHRALRLAPALALVLMAYFGTQIMHASILWSGLFAGLIFLAFVGCAIALDATTRQIVLALRARLVELIG